MKIEYLKHLKNKKNLLAFSHGTDSTALFYALLSRCEFDLCFVNYHTRASSDAEELSAISLAKKHNKNIFISHARLTKSNFESLAREFRYKFFDECMSKYDNLILAHNLNDRFEWFLMQLSRGAGLCNLLGFSGVDKRRNYTIIRPLINTPKDEIMSFLNANKYKYFVDESNFSSVHTRNNFRLSYSNDFIKNYSNGVIKSFEYLENDEKYLLGKVRKYDDLYVANNHNSLDKAIKMLGFLSSAKQKEELKICLDKNNEAELYNGDKSLCVCIYKGLYFVFLKVDCKLSKNEKELYRKNKIPNKLRIFLSYYQKDFNFLEKIINEINTN